MICIQVHAHYVSASDYSLKSLLTLLVDGLAVAGNAPRILMKTARNGLPFVSIIFCSLFSTLAYMGINAGPGRVFGWFVNMTAVAGLMTWFGISFTYIRFHKGLLAQGYDRSTLPFASKLQPYAAWYAAVACLVVCFVRVFAVIRSKSSYSFHDHSSADSPSSSKANGQRTHSSPIIYHSPSSLSFTLVRRPTTDCPSSSRMKWTL